MRSYGISIVVIFDLALALTSEAADKELLQPWPYGSYDKNTPVRRMAQANSAKTLASAEVPSADSVLAEAKAKASAEHKMIFLHLGLPGVVGASGSMLF